MSPRISKGNGTWIARGRGWRHFHVLRVRLWEDVGDVMEYVDIFGVEVGPWALMWSNPFVPELGIEEKL